MLTAASSQPDLSNASLALDQGYRPAFELERFELGSRHEAT